MVVHKAGCAYCLGTYGTKKEALKCCSTERFKTRLGYAIAYGLIIFGAILFVVGVLA
jgi:hypothetical protein